ncbi:MAG: putative metalloprotease CJM1_0395 family protein [Marinobacterium sp.]|nr:putative metalloprotease CJM1_0395 family protein [Marinobacterium sp.]
MDISATSSMTQAHQHDPRNQTGAIDSQNERPAAAPPEAVGDTVTIRSVDASNQAEKDADATYDRPVADGRAQQPADATQVDGLQRESADATEAKANENADGEQTENKNGVELTEEEQLMVSELQARDTEVRAHEAAHAAVGGQYAGSPSYTFQQGPDGNKYAIGGEVSIDTSTIPGDPQATMDKMRVVIAAANAPAEPSGQDRKVASQASSTMIEASSELARMQQEEREQLAEDAQASAEARESDSDVNGAEGAKSDAASASGATAEPGADNGPDANRSPEARAAESQQSSGTQSLAERTEAQNNLGQRLAGTGAVEGTQQGSAIDNMI